MKFQNMNKLKNIPIEKLNCLDWKEIHGIPIEDNGEKLVPVSLLPEKILVRPQYFLQGFPGSISECYLREGAWKRLRAASDLLPQGYRLVILDSYRTVDLQFYLYEKVLSEFSGESGEDADESEDSTSKFVAPPSKNPDSPPPHSTGGAVDLTIADSKGDLLNMGSGFDEFSPKSKTRYFEELIEKGEKLSPEEMEYAENRRLLFHIMKDAGFHNYHEEWWHFDYGDQIWAVIESGIKGEKAIYGGVSSPV